MVANRNTDLGTNLVQDKPTKWWRSHKEDAQYQNQVLEDLIILRAALDTGTDPYVALHYTAEHSPILRPVVNQLSAGISLREIAITWDGNPMLKRVLNTLTIAQESGCSSKDAIDSVINNIRADQVLVATLHAKTRDAAITGRILTSLPLFGLVVSLALGESNRAFLLSGFGAILVAVVLVFIALAYAWMKVLQRSVQKASRKTDPYLVACDSQGNIAPMLIGMLIAGIAGAVLYGIFGLVIGMGVGFFVGFGIAKNLDKENSPDKLEQTVQNTPIASLLEELSLAVYGGLNPAQAFTLIAPYQEEPIAKLCLNTAQQLYIQNSPIEAFPDYLSQIGRILYANQEWGAPISQTLFAQATDLRQRAQEVLTAKAEEVGTLLSIPTTLLLVPALMLAMGVPIIVPIITEVIAALRT